MGLLDFFKGKIKGHEFVAQLTVLDYFSYSSEKDLELSQQTIENYFDKTAGLISDTKLDKRYYNCYDCEGLFKQDGVIDLLKDMQPLFDAIGLTIHCKDDTYTQTSHHLTVNDTVYLMAQGSPLMWGETFVEYAKMINTELEIAGINERLYLFTDDHCIMIFLTLAQQQFIASQVKGNKIPRTPADWETYSLKQLGM